MFSSSVLRADALRVRTHSPADNSLLYLGAPQLWPVFAVSGVCACVCACVSMCPQAAMQDGYSFFLSSNGVLLTEGPLSVRYVERVTRQQLPEEWHAAGAARHAGQGRGPRGPRAPQEQQEQQ